MRVVSLIRMNHKGFQKGCSKWRISMPKGLSHYRQGAQPLKPPSNRKNSEWQWFFLRGLRMGWNINLTQTSWYSILVMCYGQHYIKSFLLCTPSFIFSIKTFPFVSFWAKKERLIMNNLKFRRKNCLHICECKRKNWINWPRGSH